MAKVRNYEVIIAGGGPAGVSSALALLMTEPSLAGNVLLLDRAHFPREKPCGGGLTGHAEAAMRRLGLALTVPNCPASVARVRYGTMERKVELLQPVRIVRREEFDQSLVEQARARGVEVLEDTALSDFSVEDGEVKVTTRRQGALFTLKTRVLVGADGSGSLVRKRLLGHRTARSNLKAPQAPRHLARPPLRLFRAEISALPGSADDARRRDDGSDSGGTMVYDFTPMRDGLRGYLWIFPVPGGRWNVGIMHYPSRHSPLSGGELARLCCTRLRDHGFHLDAGALRGWPAWGYQPAARVAMPHVLLVGDAAGIDALTGEGIAVGMEQGLIAGKEIVKGLRSGDLRFANYRQALRRENVGRELSLDRILADLLYGGDGTSYLYWLSLLLYDEELLELYAARVAGAKVLPDNKRALFWALLRHLGQAPRRRKQLVAASAAQSPSLIHAQ